MSFKFTKNNLNKLESLFERNGYKIRYEKGNFSAGYCIIKDKKVIIINKFFTTEARVNCLFDIYEKQAENDFALTDSDRKLIFTWNKMKPDEHRANDE